MVFPQFWCCFFSFCFFINIQYSFASPRSVLCSSIVIPLGYPCIDYKTTTDDGFILGVQRIPYGRYYRSTRSSRPPVFLQHGLFMGGESWFLNTPEQSLGFILADAGFDVWIGNVRGTQSSQTHITLSVNSKEFWDWSWDELATHDLPCMVELVYNVTRSRMFYVGHSQGTLIALAAFSEGRVVNRIVATALLSPIAYLDNTTSPITRIVNDARIDNILDALQVSELDFRSELLVQILDQVCASENMVCADVMNLFGGDNCCLNSSRNAYYLNYEPQPSSTKNLEHFLQMIRRGTFSKFDYGIQWNRRIYSSNVAPPYEVSNIPKDFSMFVAYGGKDAITVPHDVQRLLDMLPCNVKVSYLASYAHFDFILGTNAKVHVYNNFISFFMSKLASL